MAALSLLLLLALTHLITLFPHPTHGARKLTTLYEPPAMNLKYNNGVLLEGDLHVSILWYGKFTPSQKSIISDFILSLTKPQSTDDHGALRKNDRDSVNQWWRRVQVYLKNVGKRETRVTLSSQLTDENCSMGKLLKRTQIAEWARKVNSGPTGLTLVLTADDVAVEKFCMNSCGFHDSTALERGHGSAFIWVGNSAGQCPGQCAWPFHQPIYGPQTEPLGAPNGDVGVDGMVINIASLLAGAVTNPFGNGYFVGAGLEVGSACAGLYGEGAYPGYVGKLLVEPGTGESYNAVGVNGRKYLLPALFDAATSQCATMV